VRAEINYDIEDGTLQAPHDFDLPNGALTVMEAA
jgi:hypothetical protein